MHPNGRIHLLLIPGVAVMAAAGLAASFWVLHHARELRSRSRPARGPSARRTAS